MNSRSELRSSYRVSSSISFIFHALYCLYDCFVFTISSPFIVYGRPRCYRRLRRYRVRLRRRRPYPYRRASRQAEPLPLSHISPTVLYLSVALGICCCYVTILFNCIAYHCRPLFTFPISYAAYINILCSSGPCALLVNRLASGP